MDIKFLLPGTTRTYHSGGLVVSLKLVQFLSELRPAEVVTYKDREPDHPFLSDQDLRTFDPNTLWIVTWGPDVSTLLGQLAGHRVAYYAQSAGWSIDMREGVPILCVSRFVMGYWTLWAPRNPVFLLPPSLDPRCRNEHRPREIDVLYFSRKTTPYLDGELIPRLRERCRVETVAEPLPHAEVLDLFNRSKVYVYDFSPTPSRGWVDGFALQPLEAMVCGCTVFSTMSGGPIDYLDPGVNCGQIGRSAEHDLSAILDAVHRHTGENRDQEILRERYSEAALRERLQKLVNQLEGLELRSGDVPASVSISADDPETLRQIASRQQQEITVLKDLVRYHEDAVRIHRDGIDWLRGEVSQRDKTIASQQEGIAWLRNEVVLREHTIASIQGQTSKGLTRRNEGRNKPVSNETVMEPMSNEAIRNQYAEDRRDFFRLAFITLGYNGIAGDYAEFGCYTGTTFGLAFEAYSNARKHLSFLSFRLDRKLWALDSFRGLPAPGIPEDEHPAWGKGSLSMSVDEFHAVCAGNSIPREAYEVVEGFYSDTLRADDTSSKLPQEIALAYIDCDFYSSIMTVLQYLEPRLKHGMIIALDDYFIYSPTQAAGARRATLEFFSPSRDWRLVPYWRYGWSGMAYVVESKEIVPDALVSRLHGFI